MRYATVCSGIEAQSVAVRELGWEPIFFSEIDKFPSDLLNYHYPGPPNLGDMTQINGEKYNGTVDLISGGTPCQPFSIAGLRKGLDDPRGNLALSYLRLIDSIKPKWFIWENVPGVLSSNGGRDFATFITAIQEIGYGWAYRVLDAQYFGVPQRRRRIFLVGHYRGWQRPAAVLFDSQSMFGNIKKNQGSKRENSERNHISPGGRFTTETLPPLLASAHQKHFSDNQHIFGNKCQYFVLHGSQTPIVSTDHMHTLGRNYGRENILLMASGQKNAEISQSICPTLSCNNEQPIIFQTRYFRNGRGTPGHIAGTLTASPGISGPGDSQQCLCVNQTIRRITPLEAERIQGFPDHYTKIPNAKDGPRYKALGNSIAIPPLRWICERIDFVNNII